MTTKRKDPPAPGCVGVRTPSGMLEPCGKLQVPGTALCPHCTVLAKHYAGEAERSAARKVGNRAWKLAKAAALAASPLAADNPLPKKDPARGWGGDA